MTKSFGLHSELRGRYDKESAEAEKLYHEGWYGSPAKRPPSGQYRQNYDKINWKKEEGNDGGRAKKL